MRVILILFVIFNLTACVITPRNVMTSKSTQISPGMTKQEVQTLMGPPQNRQFHGKNEAWQYCDTGIIGALADTFVLVWINSGVVTGMQTYNDSIARGKCWSFFRTVNWGDAPRTR